MAFCFLTGAYLQSCETTRFQTSGNMTTGLNYRLKINHLFREFFHWWAIRKTLSEREDTGSPEGPVTLSFHSNKFPFLAWLSSSLSFSLHSSYILVPKPRRKTHPNWVGSSHEPTSSGPLPLTLSRNWDELWNGTLHLITGLTFRLLITRVSEIPFSWILSLLPHFHVLALGRRIPWPSGPRSCAPSEFKIGDTFSQTFLLAFSYPCVTSLFSCNGTFSIPALKISSFRMPFPKPGLPRRVKTKKTYGLF